MTLPTFLILQLELLAVGSAFLVVGRTRNVVRFVETARFRDECITFIELVASDLTDAAHISRESAPLLLFEIKLGQSAFLERQRGISEGQIHYRLAGQLRLSTIPRVCQILGHLFGGTTER